MPLEYVDLLIAVFVTIQVIHFSLTLYLANLINRAVEDKLNLFSFWFNCVKGYKSLPMKYHHCDMEVILNAKRIRWLTIFTIVSQMLIGYSIIGFGIEPG